MLRGLSTGSKDVTTLNINVLSICGSNTRVSKTEKGIHREITGHRSPVAGHMRNL